MNLQYFSVSLKSRALSCPFSPQLSHIGLALLFVGLLFVTTILAARARRHGGACQRSIMKKRFVYLSIAFAPSSPPPRCQITMSLNFSLIKENVDILSHVPLQGESKETNPGKGQDSHPDLQPLPRIYLFTKVQKLTKKSWTRENLDLSACWSQVKYSTLSSSCADLCEGQNCVMLKHLLLMI